MNVLEKDMLSQLNQHKLKENWVQRDFFIKKENIPTLQLLDNILFIQDGILHLEIEIKGTFHILTFFQSEEVIYPNYFNLEHINWRIVADTPVEIIFFNQEYFLNYGTIEPKYMEWLLEKLSKNFHKISYEMTKLNNKRGIMTNIEHLHQILKKEDQLLPKKKIFSLFSKQMLTSYCQVSRSTFNNEFKSLKNSGLLEHYL
ncbi:Crp/Fnr family transcriptional regulator [Listeria aquatica]|uniref:Crp/Fnr family transcriptional regulator n=1 Tax=Listeria aquatica TaxID=1494960 RepID=A0A841ZQM2_9LIST|nr:Crp/Fnr family transcriptional regulator [Listeria aquatica]MBC1521485.1 Crp/Fnr family transcriptional regulator [Listeria aquatica]